MPLIALRVAGFEEFAHDGLRRAVHEEQLRLPRVGPQHLEAQLVDLDGVAALGDAAEVPGDQSAYRVELGVAVGGAEGAR